MKNYTKEDKRRWNETYWRKKRRAGMEVLRVLSAAEHRR